MSRLTLIFLCLPLTLAFERFAYYLTRVTLPTWLLRDQHTTGTVPYQLYGDMELYMGFAVLLGGAVALAFGPRVTALAGVALMAAGYAALALTDASSFSNVRWLLITGSGLFRPAIYVCAGQEMRAQPETRWVLLFLVLAQVANVGAFLGTFTRGLFGDNDSGVFILCAVAATLAAGALALVIATRHKKDEPDVEMNNKLPAGIAILCAAVFPSCLIMAQSDLITMAGLGGLPAAESTLNWGVQVAGAVGILLIAVFALANKDQRLVVPLIGGGLVLSAVSVVPLLIGGTTPVLVSVVLLAPAGVLVLGLGLARVSVGTNERIGTAIVAAWLVASHVGYLFNFKSRFMWNLIGKTASRQSLYLIIIALLCAAAGVALLVFRHQLQRSYFEPPEVGESSGCKV